MNTLQLFLPCAAGVEGFLADEVHGITGLTGQDLLVGRGGVLARASWRDALLLNLHSRLAQRVLVQLGERPYRGEDDIYALAADLAWEIWFTPRQSFKVEVTAQHSPLKSLNFAALRVKDAVADRFRAKAGMRPNVETQWPDVRIHLHLTRELATVYIDTSGEPLFKRGWREDKGDAPLKETLAAALLAAAGWRGTPEQGGALHDPCCGSGTIAIEAAQIACGIAPGLSRRFAFERQRPFSVPEARTLWQQLKAEAKARIHASAVPIHASDVSFRMVDFARRNAQRAGVAAAIEFHGGDALERPAPTLPPALPGTLMINPPYGERIGVGGKAGTPHAAGGRDDNRAAPGDFFARLAAHWKRAYTQHPAGWTAWVLSPDMKLPSAMRLKESRRIPMWNGPIECRLFRFDLVAGSARAPKPVG